MISKKLLKKKKHLIRGIVALGIIAAIILLLFFSQSKNPENVSESTSERSTNESSDESDREISETPAPKKSNTPIFYGPTKTPTNTPIPSNTPTSAPPPTNTPIPDNQPPTTNVFYPTNGGEITYMIDGKVCAIASAPSDNVSPHGQIETRYAFDGNSMSDYARDRAYLCIDSLPNGPHTFKYQSRDQAGNEESVKTISFTLNLP